MTQSRSRRPPTALDQPALEAMALRYVERFQTTRARLVRYLSTRLRQRGWNGDTGPDLEALASRLAALGYIDEAAFADARTRGMKARGLGMRRIRHRLRADGVAPAPEPDGDDGNEEELALARAFARRRRLGPYGPPVTDPRVRGRQMAAMLRAGHSPQIAANVLDAETADMNGDEGAQPEKPSDTDW